MNFIVLVKQVPDIRNIPEEAWDWEKGTLKRSLLDNVCNELDKQALAFALGIREKWGGEIVGLTMGPTFADEVLLYSLSVGADAGVLLTDRKLGGADTAATAYPLAKAILKIEKEIFNGDKEYIIFSGMQSVDGDTAQVPPQIAEELGIAHIAYATSFGFTNGNLQVTRITRRGTQTVTPLRYPCLVTVAEWTEPPNASFSRTQWARHQKLYQWSAADINVEENRIGLNGSRTTVFRIFSPRDISQRKCVFETDLAKLVTMIKEAFASKAAAPEKLEQAPEYHLPEGKNPTYNGELWVFAEQEGGEINPASYELLGKAVELAAQVNQKLGAVLVGNGIKKLSGELLAYGADKVYEIEHELLNDFLPLLYSKAVSGLIEKYNPQMMLFAATPMGRELAPRVAYRAKSGLTADCTDLDIFDYKRGNQDYVAILRQTRPALGGNIMASIITQNSSVQMSTVRPGVMREIIPNKTLKGEIIEFTQVLSITDSGIKISSMEIKLATSELKDATIIVAGGGGCKNKEGFEQCVPSLAEHLGKFLGQKTMVGASRVAVESGFIDRSRQVGQTGQTVKPRLYVAVGISGAVQHVTGMQNADIIVAINKDPNARIFKTADFGIVGDLNEIAPKLIEALESRGA